MGTDGSWDQVSAGNLLEKTWWQMSRGVSGAVGCFCLLGFRVSATAAGRLRIPGEYLQTRDTFESRQQRQFLSVFACIPRKLAPTGRATDAAFLRGALRIAYFHMPKNWCVEVKGQRPHYQQRWQLLRCTLFVQEGKKPTSSELKLRQRLCAGVGPCVALPPRGTM